MYMYTIAPGPESDFGKFVRNMEADNLFRLSKGIPSDVPIDVSSKDYRNFWAGYVNRDEIQEIMKKFYEDTKKSEDASKNYIF